MATAPKKTASLNPAPAAFEAPAAVETPIPSAPAFASAPASLVELQGNLRSVVEKGLSETRDAYAKAKSAADETASAVESSFAAAKAGVAAINAKALDALRANVDANFDFVKSAFAVKNIADYVTLHGEFARKQIDAITDQAKEIGALTQKFAAETAEPIKEQVAKTFKIAV